MRMMYIYSRLQLQCLIYHLDFADTSFRCHLTKFRSVRIIMSIVRLLLTTNHPISQSVAMEQGANINSETFGLMKSFTSYTICSIV